MSSGLAPSWLSGLGGNSGGGGGSSSSSNNNNSISSVGANPPRGNGQPRPTTRTTGSTNLGGVLGTGTTTRVQSSSTPPSMGTSNITRLSTGPALLTNPNPKPRVVSMPPGPSQPYRPPMIARTGVVPDKTSSVRILTKQPVSFDQQFPSLGVPAGPKPKVSTEALKSTAVWGTTRNSSSGKYDKGTSGKVAQGTKPSLKLVNAKQRPPARLNNSKPITTPTHSNTNTNTNTNSNSNSNSDANANAPSLMGPPKQAGVGLLNSMRAAPTTIRLQQNDVRSLESMNDTTTVNNNHHHHHNVNNNNNNNNGNTSFTNSTHVTTPKSESESSTSLAPPFVTTTMATPSSSSTSTPPPFGTQPHSHSHSQPHSQSQSTSHPPFADRIAILKSKPNTTPSLSSSLDNESLSQLLSDERSRNKSKPTPKQTSITDVGWVSAPKASAQAPAPTPTPPQTTVRTKAPLTKAPTPLAPTRPTPTPPPAAAPTPTTTTTVPPTSTVSVAVPIPVVGHPSTTTMRRVMPSGVRDGGVGDGVGLGLGLLEEDERRILSLEEERRILIDMGWSNDNDESSGEDTMPLTDEEIRWFNETRKQADNQVQQPKLLLPAPTPPPWMILQPTPEQESDTDSDSDGD